MSKRVLLAGLRSPQCIRTAPLEKKQVKLVGLPELSRRWPSGRCLNDAETILLPLRLSSNLASQPSELCSEKKTGTEVCRTDPSGLDDPSLFSLSPLSL